SDEHVGTCHPTTPSTTYPSEILPITRPYPDRINSQHANTNTNVNRAGNSRTRTSRASDVSITSSRTSSVNVRASPPNETRSGNPPAAPSASTVTPATTSTYQLIT